jgi:hypothetical protein
VADADLLLLAVSDGVATLTLNRPGSLNDQRTAKFPPRSHQRPWWYV